MGGVTLTAAQVDSVAGLRDDPAVLATLRRARLSRDTAFLAVVVRAGGGGEAFRTLVRVQERDPDAVRRIMEHPRFGVWAAACALGAAPSGSARPAAAPARAEHLAAFAASAALAARVPFDLEIPTLGGLAVLPALGALAACSGGPVRLRGDGGPDALAGRPDWRPLRRLSAPCAGETMTLEFDAFPAYVGAAAFPAAEPPSAADGELWDRRLSAAVRLLAWTVPRLALPLARGMRAVIPLARELDARGSRAASLSDAFGAAAMTLPADAVAAATTLLHEFQHSKLSALSELVPLVADDAPDLYSPWRADPRPASAVLHGAFAHLAVAQLWTRLAAAAPREAGPAWHEAELTRQQTRGACADLAASGRLTGAGRRFVATLAETARTLDQAPKDSTRGRAAARLAAHRADWARARRAAAPAEAGPPGRGGP